MRFHWVFIFIGLITTIGTLISLRREHIRTEYSVSWLTVGIVLTLLGGFPGLLDGAARSLRLNPEACFLMAGGTLISALVFEISHVVSRLRDENVMMAQRIAILEIHLQELNNRNGTQDS